MDALKTADGAEYAVLDFLLWGFLSTNLESEAWNLLDSIEGQRGFEDPTSADTN